MNLLLVTQRVDDRDANLAFHVKWIAQMARRVDRLSVIAQTVGEYDLPPNVTVYSLGKERGASKVAQAWALLSLFVKLVRKHDALFVLMIQHYVLALAPFAFVFRKPIYLWYAHGHVSRLLRLASCFCRTVFTSSAGGFRIETPKRRIVGQAIDTALFSPGADIARSRNRLITVGRLSPVKHIDRLIDALVILRADHPDLELHIIGEPIIERDQTYAAQLKERVRGLGLEGAVLFRGSIVPARLPQEYRQASVCVNASTTGSLDKAVLEAMACACPAVSGNEAYRAVLPPELFVKEQTPEAYAAAIRFALAHPEAAQALREIVVRDHDRSRTIERIMDEVTRS